MSGSTGTRNTAARRVFRLLDLLCDGQLHGLRELARQLMVTTRTIRRDIAVLKECGFWVESDYGADGTTAYQLMRFNRARQIQVFRSIA